MHIDVVSDITCPWCAIGVNALERALERVGDSGIEIRFHPFQLNPDMPAEGMPLDRYLTSRVGMRPEQLAAASEMLRQRGASVGFAFGPRGAAAHVWNTFDAHQMLAYAAAEGGPGVQRKLKLALMQAYHGENRNPGAPEVLLELAEAAGLDPARSRAVLESDAYAAETRQAEELWRRRGVSGVPTMVFDNRRALSGAQPVETLEALLRAGA